MAAEASPSWFRRILDVIIDSVLTLSLCVMWVTTASTAASIAGRMAGAGQVVAAAEAATDSSTSLFFALLPFFSLMTLVREEILKKEGRWMYRGKCPFNMILKRDLPFLCISIAGAMKQVLATCKTIQEIGSFITDAGILGALIVNCLFGIPWLMRLYRLPVSALYAEGENNFCFNSVAYVRQIDWYEMVSEMAWLVCEKP
uniref:Uncharacterized protein n=1 Tax=Leersia perrieri TaxID=77586 RepID=A0A0D9X7U8_9ORYZ